MLLARGAEVNAQGGFYGNALYAASLGGHEKVVELLLAAGAEVNAQGGRYGNALRASVYTDSQEVFELVFKTGSNLNASDPYGRTILHGRFNHKMLARLQEVTPSVCLTASSSVDRTGRSILHYYATGKDNEVLRRALDITSDVNRLDNHQWTPLHWAAYLGREEHVKLLLNAGADTEIQDWQGWLPRHVAIFAGHKPIAGMLRSGNEESKILAGKKAYGRCWYCEHVRNLPDDSFTEIKN